MNRLSISRVSQLIGVAALALAAASAAQAQSAANGQALYNAVYSGNTCAGCHGATPSGTISKINNGINAQAIKNACAANKMPCPALTDAEYNDLATYIASQQPGNPAPVSIGSGAAAATSSSGGGCTLGSAGDAADPLWLVMLAGAGLALRRRKNAGASIR